MQELHIRQSFTGVRAFTFLPVAVFLVPDWPVTTPTPQPAPTPSQGL
jgi:hypothetical protein